MALACQVVNLKATIYFHDPLAAQSRTDSIAFVIADANHVGEFTGRVAHVLVLERDVRSEKVFSAADSVHGLIIPHISTIAPLLVWRLHGGDNPEHS